MVNKGQNSKKQISIGIETEMKSNKKDADTQTKSMAEENQTEISGLAHFFLFLQKGSRQPAPIQMWQQKRLVKAALGVAFIVSLHIFLVYVGEGFVSAVQK